MIARQIRPLVYLEGVPVRAYRVTIQTTAAVPTVAVIDLPPHEAFFERFQETVRGSGEYAQKPGVLPRTMVHVFYEDSEDPDNTPRLLFEGEFVRYEYVKTAADRTIRMYAKDVSNLLSSIYVRYYSDFFTPYGNLMSAVHGVGTAEKPDPENIKLALIRAGNAFNPEILSALRSDTVGGGIGVAFKDIIATALKVNAFFQDFDARTKISKKVVALVDTKSTELLQVQQLVGLIQQNMSNLKESATVWDLYMMLMALVFYFPVTVPTAPYLAAPILNTGLKGAVQVTQEKTLASLLIKPYTWWTAPANFNVIFPSQYKSFTLGRDFMAEPTRLVMSAFGVLESLAGEDLRRASPSSFLFIAPDALAKKFDREAFDTKLEIQSSNAETIFQLEEEIRQLRDTVRTQEVALLAQGLTPLQKGDIQAKIADAQGQIAQKLERRDALVAQVEKQANIHPIAQSDGKTPVQVSAHRYNRSIMTESDGVSLASREDLKGIVFAFDYLTQTQVEVTKGQGISPTALKKYLAYTANYKLAIEQHAGRQASLQLNFNPALVAGFPALVVDPHRNYYGEVDTVTHVLDAQGVADTQVVLTFVRGDEVQFAESTRNAPGKIQFPKWINPKYLPSNIGGEVYATVFPQNGSMPAARSILAYGATQIAAAQEIRRLFYISGDKDRFAYNFTRRNIATRKQVFDILGAVRVGDKFVFNALSDERMKAVLEYAAAVGTSHVSASTDQASEV